MTGFTDLYPIASLAWADGNDNWMTYITGTMNGQAAYINLRGYWEFAAKNRVEGTAVFAAVSIPLGSKASKASN